MSIQQGRRARRGRHLFGTILAAAGLTVTGLSAANAASPERALAGIRIFSRQSEVLKKYGNPSQVVVGGSSTSVAGTGTGSAGSGFGGAPGVPSGYPGAGGAPGGLPGFGGSDGGSPGEFGGGDGSGGRGGGKFGGGGFGGGRPSGSGGGSGGYGGGAPTGFGGGPSDFSGSGSGGFGGASSTTTASSKEVTWVYDRPDGSSLEFTISSDGRVVQIRATGFKSSVRTSKGLALGQSYKDVLLRYGSPESQSIVGSILNINYSERNHAAFQFYNQKLVGIVVAAVQ